MTQAFLETGQDCLVVSRLGIDHAVSLQTGLRDGGGEQILATDAPEYFAGGARRDPCREQGRCRTVRHPVAAACDLMQRRQCQSPAGKPAVDLSQTKRQDCPMPCQRALQMLDALSQFLDGDHDRVRVLATGGL